LTDAQVFGVIDRNAAGVPTAGGSAPGFAVVPSANVTGQPGFCTLERSGDPNYEFLVRFFVRATGAMAVTVRDAGWKVRPYRASLCAQLDIGLCTLPRIESGEECLGSGEHTPVGGACGLPNGAGAERCRDDYGANSKGEEESD